MKYAIEKRLDDIESKGPDWTAHLEFIDGGYLDGCDYPDDVWETLHFDNFVTAVRHRATGEVRGYCRDRRTEEQMEKDGGKLEYL